MVDYSLAEKKPIVVNKFHEHGAFVLCSLTDANAIIERFLVFGFAYVGVSDLPAEGGWFLRPAHHDARSG
jgi:hypothetical protein